jgi:hypothetical protein
VATAAPSERRSYEKYTAVKARLKMENSFSDSQAAAIVHAMDLVEDSVVHRITPRLVSREGLSTSPSLKRLHGFCITRFHTSWSQDDLSRTLEVRGRTGSASYFSPSS